MRFRKEGAGHVLKRCQKICHGHLRVIFLVVTYFTRSANVKGLRGVAANLETSASGTLLKDGG